MPYAFPSRLAQEIAFAGNDGEIDELRARVVLRRIADIEATQVDVVHSLHRIDETFAREISARPPQPLDSDLCHKESLHSTEVVVGKAGLLGLLLVLLYDGDGRAPWERHYLGNPDADAFLAKRVSERLAADERDVVELRATARFLHLPDELRAGCVLADHDHRIRLGLIDGLDGVLDLDRVALHGAGRMDFQPTLGHGDFGSLQTGQTVVVVLIEHGDLPAAGRQHLLNDFLRLVVVARAHMKDITVKRD